MITTIPYGIASDRYDRKPVLLAGLLGSAIFLCLFGLSRSLMWAILSRALCGFCNGTFNLLKSLTTEFLTSDNCRKYANNANCRRGGGGPSQPQPRQSICDFRPHSSTGICGGPNDRRSSCQTSRNFWMERPWTHFRRISLLSTMLRRHGNHSHSGDN